MNLKIEEIVNLDYTISAYLFQEYKNFLEIIPHIKEWTIKIGETLDNDKYKLIGDNIWIAKNARIDSDVTIIGPCIIDENTEIRHCAYIRGGVIIGKNCVIGNSSELKNAIIFDNCQIPHFNYVGDSIMGYHSHIGAGVIISNLKSDQSNIIIKDDEEYLETGLRKMGAIIGNNVEVGCNSVIFPGTIIMPNVNIYPLTRVRGVIPENSIVKNELEIVPKRKVLKK